jgi:hypothetical protein
MGIMSPKTEPLVCCVMLTRDRPEMAARAVRSFWAQTYERKRLLIFDSGVEPLKIVQVDGIFHADEPGRGSASIGALRNHANAYTNPHALNCDVILHWDDDDWSHPARITEQVELLQTSDADAVGYWDMLFWRTRDETAWRYTNRRCSYIVGTSLCYWRRTWERKPFKDIPHNHVGGREDSLFVQGLNVATASCMEADPRMIASIHGGNLTPYQPEAAPFNYRRVPEWDAYCRERMTL